MSESANLVIEDLVVANRVLAAQGILTADDAEAIRSGLDGVAEHMEDYPDERTFLPANAPQATRESVVRFIVGDDSNPSSIRACIRIARANARAVRHGRVVLRVAHDLDDGGIG